MFQVMFFVLLALFILADLLVVQLVKPGGPSKLTNDILGFFVYVNASVFQAIDAVKVEVVKNWHEYAILGAIYLLMLGVGGVASLFVYVLIGYLLMRLIQDIFHI